MYTFTKLFLESYFVTFLHIYQNFVQKFYKFFNFTKVTKLWKVFTQSNKIMKILSKVCTTAIELNAQPNMPKLSHSRFLLNNGDGNNQSLCQIRILKRSLIQFIVIGRELRVRGLKWSLDEGDLIWMHSDWHFYDF